MPNLASMDLSFTLCGDYTNYPQNDLPIDLSNYRSSIMRERFNNTLIMKGNVNRIVQVFIIVYLKSIRNMCFCSYLDLPKLTTMNNFSFCNMGIITVESMFLMMNSAMIAYFDDDYHYRRSESYK